MRNISILLLSIAIFSSCTPAKLLTVSSTNVPLKNSAFVFENDTVRITYHFWADNGIMDFDIYNKMSEPIFFDWKNSAFIPNDQMVSYWQDVTNTVGSSLTGSSWLYSGIVTSGASKSIHQERIGVIPPHSLIKKNDFRLVKSWMDVPKDGSYNKESSFLNFRNYLMLSTNEKFDGKPLAVDNMFYISNIKSIHYGKRADYTAPNCFVVKVSGEYKKQK